MKNTINVERAKKRISQEKLAKDIGVSKQTISNIEQSGDCKLGTAFKIAKYFGCKIQDIWD